MPRDRSCMRTYITPWPKANGGEVDQGRDIGGITWFELFVHFDTTEARTLGGKHVKDLDVEARTKERRNAGAKAK